ncbi:hypothetical protein [Candidatus Pelagibacter ubique]|uniref:hypothetical protein n=1 Tax=Pelagibacter ubique TaxID=198252 RepID=UPI0003C7DFAB
MKKFFILCMIIIIPHCGFSPIYQSNQINYQININNIEGDKIINNKIKSEIERISDKNVQEIFNIQIYTEYEKIIAAKNSKGSITDYLLIATATFIISNNEKKETIVFQEKQNVKNNSDFVEQRNYENTIKKNFATSFVKKLNLDLVSK